MQLSKRILSPIVTVFAACALLLFVWSCEYPKSPANSNTLPKTRLANVPANDTIARYISLGAIPEITLYWIGDDPDGFVIAYKYRWIDVYRGTSNPVPFTTVLNIVSLGASALQNMIIVKGTPRSLPEMYRFFSTLSNDTSDVRLILIIKDSLATGRTFAVPYKSGIIQGDSIYGALEEVHRSPTTGTFIFDSPADSNMHRFQVSSIDNSGAEDINPATVVFWTKKSPAPLMRITAPAVNTQISSGLVDTNQIAIRHATFRFLGLRIDFAALDPSTFDIEYSWAVDDTSSPTRWTPYSENQIAFVTASSFNPIATGWHTFYVRAKNRWGVLSNVASARFKATIPDIDTPGYPQRILILNSNPNFNGTVGNPDSNQIRSFYSEVLDSAGKAGKYDVWTVAGKSAVFAFPPILTLGKYTAILFLTERKIPPFPFPGGTLRFDVGRQTTMRHYLNAGGKLIFSGPQDYISSINNFEAWSGDIFHTLPGQFFPYAARQNNNRDFAGTKGLLGYPNLPIDPAKLPPDSLGCFRHILVNLPTGFAQTIGAFDSKTNDPAWEDLPVGIRFLAGEAVPPARQEYSIVHFGFPLYYAQKSPVIQAMRKALSDIRE